MTRMQFRLGNRSLAYAIAVGIAAAFGGPTVVATSVLVGTADGSGTIASGEYAGQPYVVHLSAEYSGPGLGTLTSGAGTFVQIGVERFEGIVSPVLNSLCCGEGGVVAGGFFLHGQVSHAGHTHLFDGAASTAGGVCFTIHDQTGTVVPPATPPHDPGIGGLICAPAGVLTIGTPTRTVAIDIKPGTSPNSISPGSQGLIPVAILSTAEFDATTVDPLSVRFGPHGAAEVHGRGHIQDVNGDGLPDLVLHFGTQATGIVDGDNAASLTGVTFDGDPIEGSDAIVTAPR